MATKRGIFTGLPLFLSLLFLPLSGYPQGRQNEQDIDYIIQRYVSAMGGRASLERILSVRMSGTVSFPNGVKQNITVLKKKPDLVRIVLDTGTVRFVQAYNGEVAWFSREAGRNIFHDRMRGTLAENFIREAPLESVLVNSDLSGAVLSLGEETMIFRVPCFQIIATMPDGSEVIHYIDKQEYLERRIIQKDPEGNVISEFVPSKFENINGVMFSRQIVRMEKGETISTLTIEEIETNIGILDNAFEPPVELPEN